MSLTIDNVTSVENCNHPNDWYIYFNGGYVVFSPTQGPLRFWLNGELIELTTINDVVLFQKFIHLKKTNSDLNWQDMFVSQEQLINALKQVIEFNRRDQAVHVLKCLKLQQILTS